MYVDYQTRHWTVEDEEEGYGITGPHARPPKRIPAHLPKTEFMPSRLVRTSDMQVVPGSQVREGYCALSYSWNWSGDIVEDAITGKTTRDDKRKHKITFWVKRSNGQKRIIRKSRFVKFEGVIRQICKDFNIKYIWYDQMCINQDDKEEKLREIRQMHRVYSNAYCTVALIPEFQTGCYPAEGSQKAPSYYEDIENLQNCEWLKRLWTLEEALMSPRLVFVGRDIHTWYYAASEIPLLFSICQRKTNWRVSTVLHYAHTRTSTKEHDRVFALANIFPDIMDKIPVDYNQPIQSLLIQFYGLLAKKDLSILCFGQYLEYGAKDKEKGSLLTITKDVSKLNIPIRNYDLPSWTGIEGEHLLPRVASDDTSNFLDTSFRNYTVTGRFMEVRCSGVSINPSLKSDKPFTLAFDDLPLQPFDEDISTTTTTTADSLSVDDGDNDDGMMDDMMSGGIAGYELAIAVQFPGFNGAKNVLINGVSSTAPVEDYMLDIASEKARLLSHFSMPLNKKDLVWLDTTEHAIEEHAYIDFSLTEELHSHSQYVILSGISFGYTDPNFKIFPVIKKEKANDDDGDRQYYKAIGTCYIQNPEYLFSGCTEPEQTFIIH